jgi:hypothetical protein
LQSVIFFRQQGSSGGGGGLWPGSAGAILEKKKKSRHPLRIQMPRARILNKIRADRAISSGGRLFKGRQQEVPQDDWGNSMKHWTRTYIISLSIASICQTAQAQAPYNRPATVPNPYYQSPYSPYLNLFRQGSSVAGNYYGLVRPQEQFQAGISQLQQQTNGLAQNIARAEEFQGYVVTGNRGQFLNYSRYFLNNSLQASAAPRPGQAPSTRSQPGGSSLTQSLAPGGRGGATGAATGAGAIHHWRKRCHGGPDDSTHTWSNRSPVIGARFHFQLGRLRERLRGNEDRQPA